MNTEIIRKWFSHTAELIIEDIEERDSHVRVYFLKSMADTKLIYTKILPELRKLSPHPLKIEDVESHLGVPTSQRLAKQQDVINHLLKGSVYIHVNQAPYGLAIPVAAENKRNIARPEIETNVLGPQQAFVEDLDTNIAIIRKYLTSPQLFHEQLWVGESARQEVALLYMEEIVNPENVQTIRQRIQDLQTDGLIDTNMLSQYISDNELSLFPTLLQTERPDRVADGLQNGQVAILIEGSPFVLLGPTALFHFFESPDDYYFRWSLGTFTRLLRMIAMLVSLLLTPLYVAALTFHYEMIPADLLLSLAQSRARVPFPPLFEALMMEIIIELLREAGARLPTKVGQTIGIVGGIVIGQAAVQAGITSNILIIIVAFGALSSFIAPSYVIGSTIRVIRFPVIVLAGILGLMGIMVAMSFLISHLLRITSLGRPYMSPLYPVRLGDWKNTYFRAPYSFLAKRLSIFQSRNPLRYGRKEAHQIHNLDEDE
ncbi:spore germination protein [Brevibacillus ruminantium]|uniref:Spore germination protein n=1 Tax=Brevibacillus ruminantium TaxID=2950604 RepID=A0ABY4WJH7_9BACL|nr:spore germination protein [Brevibacillus ruminantium]USG66308.1 spore germination protein [Brevibacillus ruminantium]